MIFIKNEKFSQKILFVTVCVHAHCQKIVRKMKILKDFLAILNHHIFDYYHAKFRQNRSKKIFGLSLTLFGPLCSQKIFFSDFDEILRGNSQKYGDSK